ncbi:carboxypeptidase-like regulatory domain-containing protein [Salegentibacter sp. Hel_I_6]|uniref:carboxypeptidase-like regulatory domain-containing protein n=1 Tax=Salegentibacter sp. Hel_I_6 TaxID=1250278 RepID=UPI000567D6A2|nr:carboxypeptidase-like regulatory domain-containing protein [Salegentibacter sp. Hel_I_6]
MQKVHINIILCLFSLNIYAQQVVEGYVLNANDSTAIASASVYFDGTTIGVATNTEGFFSIKAPSQINASLIISSIGYQVKAISNLSEVNKEKPIFLNENPETLEAIVLEADPWTRRRKMVEFKREFFGTSRAASSMKIINEVILKLRYNPSQKTLTASANEPLKLINRHLGYLITYNLSSFKITYNNENSRRPSPYMIYYEGFAFFEESKKEMKKRFQRRRQESFEGSILHFMRALRDQSLTEAGFKIYKDKVEAMPYEYFDIKGDKDLVNVEVLAEKLNIVYRGSEQSILEANEKFSIDQFGNYAPQKSLLLSGNMGGKRLADLLPPDFNKD